MAISRQTQAQLQPQIDVPYTLPTSGNISAHIVIICDLPSIKQWQAGKPLAGPAFDFFVTAAEKYGFGPQDFCFVSCGSPMPDLVTGSDNREKAFIDQFRESLFRTIKPMNPKLYVAFGKNAAYALTGQPVKIMKQRGVCQNFRNLDTPVLPMLSPQHALRRPEIKELFDTDMHMLRVLADSSFNVANLTIDRTPVQYEWRDDISDLIALRPRVIAVDTETARSIGADQNINPTHWYKPEVGPLTVQISWEAGKAICCPLDTDYYPMSARKTASLKHQLITLLGDRRVKKVGHNWGFDNHILSQQGIDVEGWCADTQLLAFFADENMLEKSLSECVRRWVPELSGYSDLFDHTYPKDRMRDVPHDQMLNYGCGDADATLRLADRLFRIVRKDDRSFNCHQRVHFPALVAFKKVVEQNGLRIDTQALSDFKVTLDASATEKYQKLLRLTPAKIKQKHLENKKPRELPEDVLKFSRPSFVQDILFSQDGFKLKPKVWTDSTAKLPIEQRIPSVSTKTHLPYFDHLEFVRDLIEFQKLEKMRSTYVGEEDGEAGPTGFWQYIYDGYIYPSFLLHRTVTGRAASENPNGQNIPKRSKLAKAYRKIFIPTPGYRFIEVDLSQAELRLVAWMANETTMLNIYRRGGDIHEATAAMAMGITIEAFRALPEDTRKANRQKAKAINFGFVYGMGWKKFMAYAKTDYGVTFTEKEAQVIREKYFRKYSKLEGWHKGMREFVRKHGYVRSIHGALRHLPNIYSSDEGIRSECERQAINSPIQRMASDFGLMAMARLCRDVDPDLMRPIAFIHDALVIEVRVEEAEACAAYAKHYMESNPLENWFGCEPPLPITADVSLGDNLSEMDELKTLEPIAPDFWNFEADGWNSLEEFEEYREAHQAVN